MNILGNFMLFTYGVICLLIGMAITQVPQNTVPTLNQVLPVYISLDQIMSQRDKLTIKGTYSLAVFTDTNSMFPILDEGTIGIEQIVSNYSQIQIGTIASYDPIGENYTIIHRVIDIKNDTNGTYYIFKGDNNPVNDPYKVRQGQLRRILVGLMW